jgi:hypothetical protein
MAKPKLKPKAISSEAKDWLAKPMNQQLFWKDPEAELAQFLNGHDIPPGAVSYNLGTISFRFSVLALASLLDQPEESLNYLIQSQKYQLKRYQIFIRVNALDRRPEKQGKIDYNEAGIFLARLIALGYPAEAEQLYSRMLSAAKENLFYGMDSSTATPFIFNLYAKSQGQTFLSVDFDAKRVDLYEKLVELLPGDDLTEVSSALTKACDYHMERGQYSNDEMDYAYDSDLDRIHPAEILAFLRLRHNLGLAVPNIKHLILDNPLAKLHTPKAFPEDPFLNRVAEKVDALLRNQENSNNPPLGLNSWRFARR